ncbi:sterol regulatory element binding protein cleavage-activating protein [Amylocystis lapponica]|nr:sterol regulatory element binding protein cleavage-activating protein [Amylocystis lapponica]
MYAYPSIVLQRARAFGIKFFHRFGIHCATHQIRLILVSSVVITALLSPAVAIYSSSDTHFFTGFTLRVLDSFLTPDDISSYFAQHDLRHLWEGHSNIRVREDSVARARCGMEGILRAESILIGSVSEEEGLGALDRNTLLSALKVQRRISDTLTSRGVRCLRTPSGPCFSLSPLAFWNYDEQTLSADKDVLDTLNSALNVSASGIAITRDMVLAGRELRDPTSTDIVAASFLALTYFLPDKDCVGNVGHYEWLRVLEEAAGYSGDLIVQAQTPRLIALEYDKTHSTQSRFSILSAFCYVAYFVFFVYCAAAMRHMDTVHSRFGLAITGIVEILVSTITSVSVCALVGFRVTMVPWELFPIIVIFIGVENMFHIVDAVLKTSISLPVKERIAQGLSRAGTSNTLKVVSYNSVLGVIAFFASGAIRQFCAFSIVVLVAHWFLVHTFFVTVLSIDIQRLELDELLRQNTSLAPQSLGDSSKGATRAPETTWGKAVAATKSMLRGRPAKNLSLLLLLAITATLYYATSPSPGQNKVAARTSSPHGALAQLHKVAAADRLSPAYHIWQLLNPADDALVHVRVESPTILVLALNDDGSGKEQPAMDEKPSRPRWTKLSRLWGRTGRPVWWMIRIVIMPIVVTTLMLYGLLLYLLKDAELLEAQRNRPEPDESSGDELSSVDGDVSFTTLPRAFPTDVDLIAASTNGKVVATVGLQNEFVIWRAELQTYTTIDTSGILLGSASTPSASTALTALALNDAGTFCAAGTGTGDIAVWLVSKDQIKSLPHLSLDSTCAVTNLHFAHPPKSSPPSSASSARSSPSDSPVRLFATYENGAAVSWDLESFANPRYITPTRSTSVVKSMLLPVQADEGLLVGFSLDDGTLELCSTDGRDELLAHECCINAGNPLDLVSKAHVCNTELNGERRLLVSAATQAGIVSLWDGRSKECISILDEPFGDIGGLRITPVHTKICPTCGELPAENFLLSFSVNHVVLFYRAHLTLPTRSCSCPRNQPQHIARSGLLGHRSRSGSVVSLSTNGTNTPTRSRSRLSSVSSTTSLSASMFPVSGHGFHSRRASEKDGTRRTFDTVFLNSDFDDSDGHPLGPQDVTPATDFLASHAHPSIWQSLVVVRVADATFERGSWDVVDDKIVGIRRRPRPPFVKGRGDVSATMESPQGLTASALGRWELWTFDPADSRMQASPLAALSRMGAAEPRANGRPGPTASGRISVAMPKSRRSDYFVPRLHFTRVSPFVCNSSLCMAGFGNTVGLFRFNQGLRPPPRRPSTEL